MNAIRVHARAVLTPIERPPRSASGEIPQAPLVLFNLEIPTARWGMPIC